MIGVQYEDKRPLGPLCGQKQAPAQGARRPAARTGLILGERYTIADIATFPWVRHLIGFYEAGALVGISDFKNVTRLLERFLARPAVMRGLEIPK